MKRLLVIAAFLPLLLAGRTRSTFPWFACDTAGKLLLTRQEVYDQVTQPIPAVGDRLSVVSFLVTEQAGLTGNLTGKMITATLYIAATSDTTYRIGYSGGGPDPANIRLYFTTIPGTYSLNNGEHYPDNHWWTTARVNCVDADNGVTVTLTVPLDPAQWGNALGALGSDHLAGFQNAAQHAAQIGFSFGGGWFADTGVGTATGSATLHVTSFLVQ